MATAENSPLVVELDVVEVDHGADILINEGVGTGLVHGGEPRSDGSVGDDVGTSTAGVEDAVEGLSVGSQPSLSGTVSLVHGVHILVVNIDTLEVVVLDEGGVGGGEAGGADTVGSRGFGRAEGRSHDDKTSIHGTR